MLANHADAIATNNSVLLESLPPWLTAYLVVGSKGRMVYGLKVDRAHPELPENIGEAIAALGFENVSWQTKARVSA